VIAEELARSGILCGGPLVPALILGIQRYLFIRLRSGLYAPVCALTLCSVAMAPRTRFSFWIALDFVRMPTDGSSGIGVITRRNQNFTVVVSGRFEEVARLGQESVYIPEKRRVWQIMAFKWR